MSARVLITDAEERAVLGACRGLRSAGYRVSAAARGRPAATHWSRFCSERLLLPDVRESVPAFVDGLEEVLRGGEYAALIPGSDASVLAISEHRQQLDYLTRLGLPSQEVVRRSVDKLVLLEVAAAAGLPAPDSRVCADTEEALIAAFELGFPVAVKPAQSFLPSGEGVRQQRIAIVQDRATLARVAPEFGAPFIVQRFERGGFLFSCTGVIADGRLLALTTSRVQRMWPPPGGMHTFSETVQVPPGLAGRVRALLAALEWQGIFQLQMLELEGGRFAVIDLNPRVFASVTLDARAGANLPAIWCDWLLDRMPYPVQARPGVRYRWEEGELCHLFWQLRRRKFRAAASVLRPRRRVVHAWFRLTDPGPLVARALDLGLRAIKHRTSGGSTEANENTLDGSAPPLGAKRRSARRSV
jgi:predicted ATP-grasp superfamily ATP-dependent carboligase